MYRAETWAGKKAQENKLNVAQMRVLTISVRQAAVAAQRTMTFQYDRPLERHSSFKIFSAMCYILPLMSMTQLFNGVNFVYRSV